MSSSVSEGATAIIFWEEKITLKYVCFFDNLLKHSKSQNASKNIITVSCVVTKHNINILWDSKICSLVCEQYEVKAPFCSKLLANGGQGAVSIWQFYSLEGVFSLFCRMSTLLFRGRSITLLLERVGSLWKKEYIWDKRTPSLSMFGNYFCL